MSSYFRRFVEITTWQAEESSVVWYFAQWNNRFSEEVQLICVVGLPIRKQKSLSICAVLMLEFAQLLKPSSTHWISSLKNMFLTVWSMRQLLLLRSEILSGMCAKLHTVAARNNRYHTAKSLYYCLFVPHVYGCYSSHISRPWWNAHSTSRYPQIPLNEQMFCIPFHPLKLSTFEQWNIKF